MSFKDSITPRIILTLLLGFLVNFLFVSNFTFAAIFIYIPVFGLFIDRTRYASVVFIGRAVLPITIALCAVSLWLYLHDSHKFDAYLRSTLRDYASIQDFFTILATLYAICIAFLLWKGLSDYDNLRTILRDEAATIQSINDYFFYLTGNTHNVGVSNDLRRIFIAYIENIMSGRRIKTSKENENFLRECVIAVSKLKTNDENDVIAIEEIMKQLSELSHIRSRRASFIENKMSPYLLSVLVIISVALLLPFFLREPNTNYVLHSLIFCLSSFFSFLFLTLLDINDPFDGYWSIKVGTFEDVLRILNTDIQNGGGRQA